ncbi:MAG: hypothetical protein LBJ70_05410 [Holosporales bacterium]|nr:hypothetical protein [Holosporales bacterium]
MAPAGFGYRRPYPDATPIEASRFGNFQVLRWIFAELAESSSVLEGLVLAASGRTFEEPLFGSFCMGWPPLMGIDERAVMEGPEGGPAGSVLLGGVLLTSTP